MSYASIYRTCLIPLIDKGDVRSTLILNFSTTSFKFVDSEDFCLIELSMRWMKGKANAILFIVVIEKIITFESHTCILIIAIKKWI